MSLLLPPAPAPGQLERQNRFPKTLWIIILGKSTEPRHPFSGSTCTFEPALRPAWQSPPSPGHAAHGRPSTRHTTSSADGRGLSREVKPSRTAPRRTLESAAPKRGFPGENEGIHSRFVHCSITDWVVIRDSLLPKQLEVQ